MQLETTWRWSDVVLLLLRYESYLSVYPLKQDLRNGAPMASLCNYSVSAPANLKNQRNPLRVRPLFSIGSRSIIGSRRLVRSKRISQCQASDAAAQLSPVTEDEENAMNIENLHGFINLNVGKWNGSFHVSAMSIVVCKFTSLADFGMWVPHRQLLGFCRSSDWRLCFKKKTFNTCVLVLA